jgi:tetratricopeptide (TPR) repeat protein
MEAEGKADDLAALRLAVDFQLRQNHPEAARPYLERVASSPVATPTDRAWANRTLAMIRLGTNRAADRDVALGLVDRNLAAAPDSGEDLALKATILAFRSGRQGEAIAILERLAGANRVGDDQRFLLAQLHLGQNEEAKYEGEMSRLLDREPRDPRQLAHYVHHWIDRDRPDQADRWLAELKRVDPRGRPAFELEARLLDAKKRRPELLALLQARAREVPDDTGHVADLFKAYGFAREAEAGYMAFIARAPEQPARTLALASFLAQQDRVAEAMEILKKAWTTCRPEQVAVVALSLYDAPSAGDGERRQIEAWTTKAVQEHPELDLLASKLGVIYLRQGRFDDAERILRRVIDGHPDNADALNGLAWLLSLRDSGRASEAVRLIDRAIEIQGKAPALADTRAVALIQLGQADRALEDLLQVRKQSPRNPSYALHLAWAYRAKGQDDQARSQLDEADRLGLKLQALDPLERAIVVKLRQELSRG